jgi:hypothetical protein
MLNKKCGLCVGLITLLGLFISVAVADPLPASVLTNGVQKDTLVNVPGGNPTYPVSFSFGSGGGFTATIDSTNTVMWCVDAMEDISPPALYNADLVEVSKIAANPSYVRYGLVTSWGIDMPTYDTAQQRFEMATYLVSLYPGVPAGPNPSNTLMDRELQAAIWEIMWNNSITPGGGITLSSITSGGTDPATDFTSTEQTQVTAYITQAKSFVHNNPNASLFNYYAVVSGGVSSDGSLSSPPTLGTQTYIVLLTPEPASIIMLGSLIASVFALTRRHRARRVSQMS